MLITTNTVNAQMRNAVRNNIKVLHKLIEFKSKKDEMKYPGILFLMYRWQVKVSDMIDTRLNNENKSQFSYFSIFPQFKIKLHSMHIDNIFLKELIRYHLLIQFKYDENKKITHLRTRDIKNYMTSIDNNNVKLQYGIKFLI